MANLPIHILAEWDHEASVWVAASDDIDGFVMEDTTIERPAPRVPGVLEDLIEGNHPELAVFSEIPFTIHASLTGHLIRSA